MAQPEVVDTALREKNYDNGKYAIEAALVLKDKSVKSWSASFEDEKSRNTAKVLFKVVMHSVTGKTPLNSPPEGW